MKQTKIRHNFEYHQFIVWISLPKELRDPKTQAELSKHFGVGQDTLSEWKKKVGFWSEVSKLRKEWSKEKTSDVVHALYKRAIETGSASEVKLWFQLVEEWSEKLTTFTESDNPLRSLSDSELADHIKKLKARFSKTD